MFMRYRGGGVGHKSICEATRCLLDDCDKLNSQPFTLQGNHESPFAEDAEDSGNDDILMDESRDPEEGGSDEDEVEMDNIDLEHVPQLIDDKLKDKMDKYGYNGLDQVLDNVEEDAEMPNDEDTLAPEDLEDADL
ncbi:hypothetical protein SCLCIDRAFT_1147209 [Scleroderma citrinum Foug A]|uniref:Uncharacterized protein n=1 Tax=Scleroderma citrinum Foug A TaxID=1036808 RepID=A0A0C3D650_9AGAM|nr:hypothetical protein SCLCIDRAFT_1147209 [Scleroderma citrinum Foug A]